jgi:hypothetical protein
MAGTGDDAELRRARSATTWKMIASAAAAGALSAVIVTSLHDRKDERRSEGQRPTVTVPTQTIASDASAGPAAPAGALAASAPGEPAPPAAPAEPAQQGPAGEPASIATTTGAELDGGTDAAGGRDVATPTVAANAAPGGAPDAGPEDAGPSAGVEEAGPSEAERAARDAGGAAPDPWAPPPMSAGAGRFTTEAPPWAASAFTSDPNAGAGRFTTEAPPWAASAFTSNPNAGAGPFTTERNLPAFGFMWPYLVWPPPPVPPPPQPGP